MNCAWGLDLAVLRAQECSPDQASTLLYVISGARGMSTQVTVSHRQGRAEREEEMGPPFHQAGPWSWVGLIWARFSQGAGSREPPTAPQAVSVPPAIICSLEQQ